MTYATDRLSPREREVYRLILNLYSTREIAFALGIAYNTVKRHVVSVLWKLRAYSRRELVRREWDTLPEEIAP